MALLGGKDPYKGKHKDNPAGKHRGESDNAEVYIPRHDVCTHASTVVLAGRIVCNDGCAADLGPANG